jgi:hypothetical protein
VICTIKAHTARSAEQDILLLTEAMQKARSPAEKTTVVRRSKRVFAITEHHVAALTRPALALVDSSAIALMGQLRFTQSLIINQQLGNQPLQTFLLCL